VPSGIFSTLAWMFRRVVLIIINPPDIDQVPLPEPVLE
jgi:hypothetical protein